MRTLADFLTTPTCFFSVMNTGFLDFALTEYEYLSFSQKEIALASVICAFTNVKGKESPEMAEWVAVVRQNLSGYLDDSEQCVQCDKFV